MRTVGNGEEWQRRNEKQRHGAQRRAKNVWKTLHQVLFGLFGCGSFVLGAAVCCLAVLYTRGEDLLPHICKLALGLVFASGTVIVFSDIQPQGLSAFQMVAACYQNGYQAWLSGGALGAVLGGNLLLLCGRPAANFIMLVRRDGGPGRIRGRSRSGRALPSGSAGLDVRCAALGP